MCFLNYVKTCNSIFDCKAFILINLNHIVPDTRKDDIAALQAQMTPVLITLSEQQGTSQHVNAVNGASNSASDAPHPGLTQKKTCWTCGKAGNIA